MMKRLEKNRRIFTVVGMLAVTVVSAGCGQHVSLAENTEQPGMVIIQQSIGFDKDSRGGDSK